MVEVPWFSIEDPKRKLLYIASGKNGALTYDITNKFYPELKS